MHGFTIVASANSRLHADVILIRLRRAEVDWRKISVLFPQNSMPNAVGCWLPVAPVAKQKIGVETIACAGRLRKLRNVMAPSHDEGREIAELLMHAGVDAMGAHILSERLSEGHILLVVHASSETQVSVAWHVFRHSSANTIIVAEARRSRSSRHDREIPQIAPWVPTAA
jgi:hypothetical protein